MSGLTSMQLALKHLDNATSSIKRAMEELGQLDRCTHTDYPSGVPPLKRCILKVGHEPTIHLYPEKSWFDGGKTYHDMTIEEQLQYHRDNK